jgi:steroid 5-alpha reductase family enzyme
LPVVILNSPAVSDFSMGGDNPSFGTGRDIAGIVLWALGFIVESWADIAKVSIDGPSLLGVEFWLTSGRPIQFWHKSNNPPKNRPCTAQVWAWSRHPPYFGEIILQWGIWILTRKSGSRVCRSHVVRQLTIASASLAIDQWTCRRGCSERSVWIRRRADLYHSLVSRDHPDMIPSPSLSSPG